MPSRKKQHLLSRATTYKILIFFFAVAVFFSGLTWFLYKENIYNELSEVLTVIAESLALLLVTMMGSLWLLRRMDTRLGDTKKALHGSHERLRQITDHIPGAVYRYRRNLDGKQVFEFISEGSLDLLGYSAQKIMSQFDLVWNLVVPEDMAGLTSSIEQSFKTGNPWICEFRIKRPDRSEVQWIRGRSNAEKPLPDGSVHWNGVFVDITKEKEIEQRTRDSAKYLDRLINAVADPIFVKDRQHCWVLLNDAMCRLFGVSRDQLLGKSDYDFFPKKEADIFWEKDEEVF